MAMDPAITFQTALVRVCAMYEDMLAQQFDQIQALQARVSELESTDGRCEVGADNGHAHGIEVLPPTEAPGEPSRQPSSRKMRDA